MPNWCEGVLKVRGKKKDLIKFLKNGIERLEYSKDENYLIKEIPLNLEMDERFGEYQLSYSDGWQIKDTRRCFVDYLEWYFTTHNEDDDVMIQYIDIRQAWRLEVEQFANISRKYHIDFKIKGYEKGCEFSQEFEILNGYITKYEEKQYENWCWEVDDPRLGG